MSSSGTIQALLATRAESDPESPAILSPGRDPLSAAVLRRQLDDVRALLHSHGLGRGDRVAVLAGLGPDAAIATLGVIGCAVCLPMNPQAGSELDAALSETRAQALLLDDGADPAAAEAARRAGVTVLSRTAPTDGGGPAAAADADPADADDVALVLRTSGTTGRPKLVPATHRQLIARAGKAGRLLEIGEDDRCLSPMALCYAHGLYSGLLMPLLTGGATILPATFDAATFLECLEELAPTWYTAGATHQQAILRWLRERQPAVVEHLLRFTRSGAAALPGAARSELEGLLGVPVLEAYSTSETGIVTTNRPSGARRPGTVGVSDDGEVAILDEGGRRMPPGHSGEVAVRGPTVFAGYEGDPELNRRSLRDGWFHTGDQGSLDESGFLTLEGRLDEVINRGGEKVSPREVERALLEHPAVSEAVVFALPHPTLGAEVAAAVRPEPGRRAEEPALREFVAQRLARIKVPRRIVSVAELPAGPSGKPLRFGIAERLGLESPAARAPTGGEPPDALKRALAGLWAQALERDEVGPDEDFFALGGDSLRALELFAAIEAEFEVGLGLEDLLDAPTPRQLAATMFHGAYLDAHRPSGGTRDVIGANTGGDRVPLFVVAGRPGYALRPMLVGRELDPSQPVYGLQPPGMDWDAAGARTLPEMASHYLGLVRGIQPHGPYRMLGTSFGGLVVYEMARQLEGSGEEVSFLGIVDTAPPTCRWDGRVDAQPNPVEATDEEGGPERPGAIVTSGTRVAAAHLDARRSYVIDDRLECELTFLLCASEGILAARDRRSLWAQATRGRFRLVTLPGFHARLVEEPQFSALRDALRLCLSESPPAGLDPAEVFDRSYSLGGEPGQETITASGGESFRVEQGAMHGRLRRGRSSLGKLIVRGWACDGDRRLAGDTVVAFVGGRYAAYSQCGAPSHNLARRHSAPGLGHAGFRMRLEMPIDDREAPRPRVFALSADGRASELTYAA